MKKLILLVGISGSGKTTLAKQLVERGFQRLNADAIRAELYGSEAEQGDPKQVFAIFFERLEDLFAQGADVVIDNTNLKLKHRKEILDRAENAGYKDKELWVLDVALEVCLERNHNRDRMVEEAVIINQLKEFNRNGRPRHEEGRLVFIKPGKNKDEFLFLS